MLGVGRQRVRDGVCAGRWNSARYSPPWKLVCEAARRERTVIQTDRQRNARPKPRIYGFARAR